MMRKIYLTGIGFFILFFSPARLMAQKDAFENRWKGEKTEGAAYGARILSPQDNNEVLFKVDRERLDTGVQAKEPADPVVLNHRFDIRGDLTGRWELLGDQTVDLSYNLKGVDDLAAQATPPAKPQVGQAPPKAEEDDFSKLLAENDAAAKKRMIDEFLQKYPESGLTGQVHRVAADLGQRTNNADMIIKHGERALVAFPEDFPVMSILANAYVERNELDKSEELATRALELIGGFQKPAQMPEEEWTTTKKALMGGNFSTLGMIHLRRAQAAQNPAEKKSGAEKAVAPLKKAIENQPKDDYSYYYLGFAYVLLNDYSNAESSLAKAVALNGVASPNARKLLEDLYKTQHKNSLEGLDKVIAKAKSELEP
jgi:tetratricopeptide (TPR) repeat protein